MAAALFVVAGAAQQLMCPLPAAAHEYGDKGVKDYRNALKEEATLPEGAHTLLPPTCVI
jgi:hypothetical protein